jgi:hypothetical protein
LRSWYGKEPTLRYKLSPYPPAAYTSLKRSTATATVPPPSTSLADPCTQRNTPLVSSLTRKPALCTFMLVTVFQSVAGCAGSKYTLPPVTPG